MVMIVVLSMSNRLEHRDASRDDDVVDRSAEAEWGETSVTKANRQQCMFTVEAKNGFESAA